MRTVLDPPYRGIVFDCDSTLATIEGIEALADAAPEAVRERIAALTAQAMDGALPLQDAYGARLSELQPTKEQVERVGAAYIANALPNARELVAALHHLGKAIFVVSGGLLAPVQVLAQHLGIPVAQTHAVDVHFDDQGHYAGFEANSPLAQAGGKLELLTPMAKEYGPLALIGDGATDLEAAPVCARFVAFAGVEARAKVMQAADVVCVHADLAALLPLLCSPEEISALADHPEHANLVARAQTYL